MISATDETTRPRAAPRSGGTTRVTRPCASSSRGVRGRRGRALRPRAANDRETRPGRRRCRPGDVRGPHPQPRRVPRRRPPDDVALPRTTGSRSAPPPASLPEPAVAPRPSPRSSTCPIATAPTSRRRRQPRRRSSSATSAARISGTPDRRSSSLAPRRPPRGILRGAPSRRCARSRTNRDRRHPRPPRGHGASMADRANSQGPPRVGAAARKGQWEVASWSSRPLRRRSPGGVSSSSLTACRADAIRSRAMRWRSAVLDASPKQTNPRARPTPRLPLRSAPAACRGGGSGPRAP